MGKGDSANFDIHTSTHTPRNYMYMYTNSPPPHAHNKLQQAKKSRCPALENDVYNMIYIN